MVEIVENWTEIIGIVIALIPAPGRDGFVAMTVKLDEVRAVDHYPNLVQAKPDDSVTVLARNGQIDDDRFGTGCPVDLHLRVAGPPITYFTDGD